MEIPGMTIHKKSLTELCLDSCSRNIDRMRDMSQLPVDFYLEIIRRAKTKITPKIIGRIETFNPHLQCAETDEGYWKPLVEKSFQRRQIPAPFPVLYKAVKSNRKVLLKWSASNFESQSRPAVETALQELSKIPVSAALLEKSKIGVEVGKVKNCPIEDIAKKAKELLKKWKVDVVGYQKALEAGNFADTKSKLRDSQGHIEEAAQCQTWKEFFEFMKNYDEVRMESFGKKSRELYTEDKNQKHGIKSGVAFHGERKKRGDQIKVKLSKTIEVIKSKATSKPASKISQWKADFSQRQRMMNVGSSIDSSKRKLSGLNSTPDSKKRTIQRL